MMIKHLKLIPPQGKMQIYFQEIIFKIVKIERVCNNKQ